MQLYRGLDTQLPPSKTSAVTIGNFDGVHRGHQQLLIKTKEQAKQHQAQSVVMTFEPLPEEYFAPAKAPGRLSRLREKLQQIKSHDIDATWLLRFNDDLASISAESFIQDILVKKLHCKSLILGDDFRFGKNRQGDIRLLQLAAKDFNFEVHGLGSQCQQGDRISSTRIRQLLQKGQFKIARELLGYPYHMSGRVIHGKKLGRKLGFPTANIALGRPSSPLHGIYAIWAVLDKQPQAIRGVASLGSRPTLDSNNQHLLEVHLFDFSENIYGQHMTVYFEKFIREEIRFPDLDTLVKHMHKDILSAQHILDTDIPEYIHGGKRL